MKGENVKVILHQFWVKTFFPWKLNLEYGGTFTKLFMHVSSRDMFTTTRNLQICVLILVQQFPQQNYCKAASNITYRPIIQAANTGRWYRPQIGADDTCRCTLIIWPIFGTRLISFTWSFNLICLYNWPIQKTKEKKTRNPYLIFFLVRSFIKCS
jgi:hypothetical protein